MTKVTITTNENVATETCQSFKDVESFILNAIRSWNNFTPEQGINISLEKLSDPNDLGVVSSDGINTADLFGRP